MTGGMSRALAPALLVATTTVAAAAPPGETPPVSATKAARPQLAIAVNSPFMWPEGHSLGGSVYVGFAKHHAIRANVASYEYSTGISTLIGDVFFDGDGDDAIRTGRYFDVSAGYM